MYPAVYLTSAYLAPVQYYSKIVHSERVFIEQHDHYMKQTYRNRCTIAGVNGPLSLILPIEKSPTPKCSMKEILISDHGNWRHLHRNALESAYRNSAFYDYYIDYFIPFYEKRYRFLFDLNLELCQLICRLIAIDTPLTATTGFIREPRENEKDFREIIHPKKEVVCTDPDFIAQPYYQVFQQKHGFLPNLSIVDLLFNMGPESLLVLHRSFPGK